MDRCETCFNSRPMMFDNDTHFVCCLAQTKALDCLARHQDYYINRDKVANNMYRPYPNKLSERKKDNG